MQLFNDLPNSEIEKNIDEWIKNERNRKILKRRFIDGICYEKLAEEFDLSTRQVIKIVKSGQMELSQKVHD